MSAVRLTKLLIPSRLKRIELILADGPQALLPGMVSSISFSAAESGADSRMDISITAITSRSSVFPIIQVPPFYGEFSSSSERLLSSDFYIFLTEPEEKASKFSPWK